MSDSIVERLRHLAEKQMALAACVSILCKPKTDNELGRSACLIHEAADHIEAQATEIERLQISVAITARAEYAAKQRIEELEALEEVVNAFKQGLGGIHKLVTEILDGHTELTRLREVVGHPQEPPFSPRSSATRSQ